MNGVWQAAVRLLSSIIFLPIVMQPGPLAAREPYYGLAPAMQPASDIDLIGAQWYHAWRPSNPYPGIQAEFVPMLWHGLPDESLPADYSGVILVGNEPDNPNQLNISPQEMARRLALTRQHYPRARLLCCGTLSYHYDWLAQFMALGVLPDAWQVHAYIEGPFAASDIIAQLDAFHRLTGGPAWITEYGSLNGDVAQFAQLTTWMEQQTWIERIAPYTNRQPHQGQWWEIDARVELVAPDGTLTDLGSWYTGRIKQQP